MMKSLARMIGGEIFVPNLPSMRLTTLAEALLLEKKGTTSLIEEIGKRKGGEKYHEALMTRAEKDRSFHDYNNLFLIAPEQRTWSVEPYEGIPGAGSVFPIDSSLNMEFMGRDLLREYVRPYV